MLAWHLIKNYKLNFDLLQTEAFIGLEVRTSSPLIIGVSGLHAALNLVEALKFATGTILCQVELQEPIVASGGLVCSSVRTIKSMVEIGALLEACYQKLIVGIILQETESNKKNLESFIEALKIKRSFNLNQITAEQLQISEKKKWKEYILFREKNNDRRADLLALWCVRSLLLEENSNKRNKPIILGNLCSWLLEIQSLSDSQNLLLKFESLLLKSIKQNCPEFETN